MSMLILRAYWRLILFDICIFRGDFASLYRKVQSTSAGKRAGDTGTVERVCSAVDLASIWYWKKPRCLLRSAVTAFLLRLHGVPASLVIGAQAWPFRAHAWVEVDGRVVNDKSYTRELYSVLEPVATRMAISRCSTMHFTPPRNPAAKCSRSSPLREW
jgi:hypothetical protein